VNSGHDAWTGAWAASMQQPGSLESANWSEAGFRDQSVRQVVRISTGGSRVRIRLSNAYGKSPLRLAGATIALAGKRAAMRPGSLRRLRFGRRSGVTIPAGQTAASAPVRLKVKALDKLSVTLYFKDSTGPATFHSIAGQTSYRASGDHRMDHIGTSFSETSTSWYYLTGVDVSGRHTAEKAVVTVGDSLVDGAGSTPDADHRLPDALAERLVAAGRSMSVLNAGLGGNRVLNDSPCFGDKAISRFQRDVAAQPGAQTVIVMEGINDIGFSENDFPPCTVPNPQVSAEELIAGHRSLIKEAHAHGLKIVGGTMTPFQGSGFYTERGEKVRAAVNDWIRASGEYDAVADFDRALADGRKLRPEYDSGDHLHPNDAGYKAMAAVIDLATL
jgi:lysophospholipase L1-like esterase